MRISVCLLTIVVVGCYLATTSAISQDSKPVSSEEKTTSDESDPVLQEIRDSSKKFETAVNQHDAAQVAAFWTKDGEYIDESGQRLAGRDAIRKGYEEFFSANPDAKITVEIDELRKLGEDLVIEEGRISMLGSQESVAGHSRYTALHVKREGHWKMASVRDHFIENPPVVQSAADLKFLVGDWHAEEHGVKVDFSCGWIVDETFLQRKYTMTQLDGTTASGVQIIGWNPQGEFVQSWEFSPGGGHAVGAWYPIEGGWQAEVEGMTGEGVPTSAVNTLKRLDDNAYVWQSMQRTLGDISLPDTDEVIIKRRSND